MYDLVNGRLTRETNKANRNIVYLLSDELRC